MSVYMRAQSILWQRWHFLLLASSLFISDGVGAAPPVPSEPNKPGYDIHGDVLPVGAVARCGTIRLRHGSDVRTEFSPKGDLILAVGSLDSAPLLWDVKTGKEVNHLEGVKGPFLDAAFVNQGTGIVAIGDITGRGGRTLGFWEVKDGNAALKHKIEKLPLNYPLVVSPDGKTVAVEGKAGTVIHLWDASKGEELRRLTWEKHSPNYEPVICSFSPDGTRLAAVSSDKVRLWNIMTGKEERSFKLNEEKVEVTSFAFSHDGKKLILGQVGGLVQSYEIATNKVTAEWKGSFSDAVAAVKVNPDGSRLAVARGVEGNLFILDATSLKVVDTPEFFDVVTTMSFSPDGQRLLLGNESGTVEIYDLASKKWLFPFAAHHGGVQSIGFSADDSTLISGSKDGTVRLWDPLTGKEVSVLKRVKGGSQISAITLLDKRVLFAQTPGEFKSWDDGSVQKVSVLGKNDEDSRCMSISPDGKHCVAGLRDGALVLRPLPFGKESWRIRAHALCVYSARFSPDGLYVATSGSEEHGVAVCVWDRDKGGRLFRHEDLKSALSTDVAFTADGKRFACGLSQELNVWDRASGKELLRKKFTNEDVGSWISAVAFSPDAKTLAMGGFDGAIHVLDAESGKRIRRLPGHRGEITEIRFSNNGKLIATASTDSTVLVWKVPD
jgi:WD40 repeat protein